jgi:DNA-binding NtrC family response regulator
MADHRIVLIDDDENVLKVITAMLESPEYEVLPFTNAKDALDVMSQGGVDLVITDLKMSPIGGLEVLRRVKRKRPNVEVLILTAHATVENAIKAMKEEAFDYLIKPVKMEELKISVGRALSHQKICRENRYLKDQLQEKYRLHNIVGRSRGMQKVFEVIEKVAPTDLTVLIGGESGTGKELVAKALHYASPRKDYPFVAINCGAIPEALLESELFGHVRGAFTGAIVNKKGLFGEAHKGTIFLDEISSTSPALQVSLLRVLEEKEYRSVGDSKGSKVDVRVIAATNLSLEAEIKKQNFRQDLYYRLSVVNMDLPPLRERKEDIPLLAEYFLEKSGSHGSIKRLDKRALYALAQYGWPGNVRELENVLESIAYLVEGEVITVSDLPEKIRRPDGQAGGPSKGESLKAYLKDRERTHIEEVLGDIKDKKKAAQKLGISLPSLYRKMSQMNIPF